MWRGIIAEDFTFTGVRAVSQAIGEYVLSQDPRAGDRGMVIGYDTRFLSEAFAAQVARVMAAQGIIAFLCERDTPTPVVAHEIIRRHAAGGVIVTASQNPPEFNGIKFSAAWGGPALPEATQKIQERANQLLLDPRVREVSTGEAEGQGLIERIDPRPAYLNRVRSLVSLETIREARLRVVIDPLYGSAHGYLDTLLRDAGCEVAVLHGFRDPNFGGLSPEPGENQLQELAFQVVESSANLRAGDRRGCGPVRAGGCGRVVPGAELLSRDPAAPPGEDPRMDRRRGPLRGDHPPSGRGGAPDGDPGLRDAGRLQIYRRADRQGCDRTGRGGERRTLGQGARPREGRDPRLPASGGTGGVAGRSAPQNAASRALWRGRDFPHETAGLPAGAKRRGRPGGTTEASRPGTWRAWR